MNILFFGSSGFIGKHTRHILQQHGCRITAPSHCDFDFLHPDADKAHSLMQGQDLVINTVGIMSRHTDVLETVHHHTPELLARCAHEAGVKHWIQLSALGADAKETIAFTGSKGRGDQAVSDSGLQAAIARPSVVYGRGGASCELFIRLAKLPFFILPCGGRFMLQPVHVNDIAQGLAALCLNPPAHGTVINMTGTETLSLADYLNTLRQTLHRKPKAAVCPLPLPLLRPFLPITNYLSNGFLSPDSIRLLQQGSCADYNDFAALLGRKPLGAHQFAG